MLKKYIVIISVLFLASCVSNNKSNKKNSAEAVSIKPNKETIVEPTEKVEEEVLVVEINKPVAVKEPPKKIIIKKQKGPIEKPSIPKPKSKPAPKQAIKVKQQSVTGTINFSNSTDAILGSSIVFFKPDDGKYPDIKPKNYEIKTRNKRFEPSVLAIPVGSEVKFPNMDRILHNVFSVSPKSPFDLGLYSAGTVKSIKFDNAGVIYVHCNVHHSMQADILVLETPWYAQANQDGGFEIKGLPNKDGTLYLWHPRAKLTSKKVTANPITKLDFDLEITRKKVPKHLNKFGESYRPQKK